MTPPHFWRGTIDPRSREAAPLTKALLTPFAAIYAWAVARRLARARSHRVAIPIICVGNLTLGGSGKTPVVAMLRDHIATWELRVASLSRGYKGSLKGPLRVDPAIHTASEVGDEPRMLAARGETWIGADRPAAADAMVADGVQVIIMDDGHQNPSLHRDLSLVVLDAGDPFGNGHVFPKGPLREPVSAGLQRANAVVLSGAGPDPDGNWPCPVLRASIIPTAAPPTGPLVAFAGIGRPQKFFDSLEAVGAVLAETVSYPDHHTYTARELAWLQTLAQERGATLITTEKDAVKLPTAFAETVSVWPIGVEIVPANTLDRLLQTAIGAVSHD